jgi:hypothetical protein
VVTLPPAPDRAAAGTGEEGRAGDAPVPAGSAPRPRGEVPAGALLAAALALLAVAVVAALLLG